MFTRSLVAVLLLVSLLLAGQSSAGTIYLSTSATNPVPGVPEWNMNVGESTTLYLWFQLPSDEQVNGISIDLACDNPGVVTSSGSVTVANPTVNGKTRWNSGKVNGTTGSPTALIDNMRLFAINENGINGYFGALDPTVKNTNSYRVASVTITAQAIGTSEVRITTGPDGGISYSDYQYYDPDKEIIIIFASPSTTNFGPDDPVDPRQVGVTGASPDAIIHVVPEPATLSLLVLGGLAILRRR